MECSFVVSSEFGSVDLTRARFFALELSRGPRGVALHADDPAPRMKLDLPAGGMFESGRLMAGERSYPFRPAASDGAIERVSASEGSWVIEGWARDSVSGELPAGVLLFDGDSPLPARYESRFQERRDGVVDRSGFKLVLPRSELRETGQSMIRAIAFFRRGVALHLGLIERTGLELSRTVRRMDSLSLEELSKVVKSGKGWRYEHPQAPREWTIGKWRFGFLDMIDRRPEKLTIHGWALEPPTGVVAEAVLITANGKPVALTRMNTERVDLMREHKLPSPLIAGFQLSFALAHHAAEINVYALWPSGTATELPLYGS
jgi:hypothetical protein